MHWAKRAKASYRYIPLYALNQDIDTSIVKAFAHYSDNTTKDVTSSVQIDKSKYNKDKNGTYEIIISYI